LTLSYGEMKIREQLSYISIAAEIANIFSSLSIIFSIKLLRSFRVGIGLFNAVYALYVWFSLFSDKKNIRRGSYIIFILALLKDDFWKNNPIICIIDSITCLLILIITHFPIYKYGEKVDTCIRNQNSK